MATWTTVRGLSGDVGQKPVKNVVWLNLTTTFEVKLQVITGEVRVTVKQRDGWRIGYRTKMDSDYGVRSWGPWKFAPKRAKADFKVTMETRRANTSFNYSYYA